MATPPLWTIGIPLLLGALLACAPPEAPPAPPAPTAPAPEVLETRHVRSLPLPPSFLAAVEAGTRTLDGAPGPGYWQQRVRYDLHVELHPEDQTLHGHGRIRYHNESPDTLDLLVLNLYQNVFAPGVRRNRQVAVTGGVTLHEVRVQGRRLPEIAPGATATGYTVDGTIARLPLPRPLTPGGVADVEVEWSHTVPPAGTFRTAWEDALGGRAFHVAQWYPQIATYDDVAGWDTGPYLGDGEFYLGYGEFDVTVSVPDGWIVAATGLLENPEEVLTDEARLRLREAMDRPERTRVITAADHEAGNATQPSMDGRLSWRFTASEVRDFAFAASDRYLWDVLPTRVPSMGGEVRTIPAHAFYRLGAPNWEQAAEFTRHAMDLFQEMLVPYPYPQVTVAEGPVFGMEYPMVNFIGKPANEVSLHSVIAHEVAHQWYPMMVGTNEAADAWIDEGLASWLDALATYDRFGGDPFGSYRSSYLALAGTEAEVPVARHTDLVTPYGSRGVAAYAKPGLLFRALREILGEETFHQALDTFTREWAFRHPTPWDLFHTFERVHGEELSWFWWPWFFTTEVLDREIESVEEPGDGRVRVVIRDRGEIAAPAEVVVRTTGGEAIRAWIPVDRWLEGHRTATVYLEAGEGEVESVELDPRGIFPDLTPERNRWPREE